MRAKIIAGSRGSRLALIQTESVAAGLSKRNPGVEVSISKITTRGDHDRHVPLEQMAGTGVFVKELESALLAGRIDLAVHSLKDVPTEIPPGLCLRAVTERLDPSDVLVSRDGRLDELPSGAQIGTGSLRRAAQLAQYRPDLEIRGIRGNVDTRLGKVACGEFDGVIVAAAAMLRLGWRSKISEYLPLAHFVPAVGQGALVIETRIDDKEIANLISPLNHRPTWQSITAERAFLSALGGGCRAPIAALATIEGDTIKLTGMAADASGKNILRAAEEDSVSSPEELGVHLAQKLLEMGASEFIAEAKYR